MTVELIPVDPSALPAWVEAQRIEYVRARMTAGDDLHAAERNARESHERYFPQGRPAPGHEVFRVVAEGVPVGVLWVGPHPNDLEGVAWVWDVEIDEPFRGRGYGRAAMLAAESWAVGTGYRALALNVFGHNTVARGLYESLGFETTAVQLRKEL